MAHLDIQSAQLAHITWKTKLIDFFYGFQNLTRQDVMTHKECAFGQWLYSSGLQEYANHPIIHDIERIHKQVHDEIIAIVSLSKDELESDATKKRVEEFENTCNTLVSKLDDLDAQSR